MSGATLPAPMERIARRLAAALAIGLALAACSAQPAATSPTMTPAPTATNAASGFVEHPTEANVVILRLDEGGGLVPFGFFATQLPAFSLYGDGTIIFRRAIVDPKGVAGQVLHRATMNGAQVSALLGFALEQGGLAKARADYPNPSVADGTSSIFTIRANRLDKTVSVYALGIVAPDTPDAVIRGRFYELAELLRDVDAQVAQGRATDAGAYDPPGYRAILAEALGFPSEVREWPWQDLAPADFTTGPNDPAFAGRRYAVVTPEQARQFAPSPESGVDPVAVRGPDGVTYTLALRPLLPDETE